MCGIAGIIALDKSAKSDPQLLVDMCDRIAHRGPDGEGYLLSQHFEGGFATRLLEKRPEALVETQELPRPVLLGHRRLSIIDLTTTAGQPMTDVTGRYRIVFNGEIYNHRELRTELEKLGLQFRTDHSDTEVLLNAYAAWGKGCLEKLRGMFAFVLYDKAEDTALIVRDRLGIKPLYYAIHNNQFLFGSEIKTILTEKNISREFDREAVSDYFSFLSVAAPKTIFKAIHKLQPAHFMELKGGELLPPQRYWDVLATPVKERSEKQVMEELFDELEASAKYRMEADVDYGVLLSGGVDSTANLCMLSRQTSKPIKAFSIGFSNDFPGYQNEFEYSRMAAKAFGAEYHEIELQPKQFNDFFSQMVWFQDEPIADTANIPIYYIAKTAKDNGVTVLLGGEGADELMIGYAHWNIAYQFYKTFEVGNKKGMARMASMVHALPVLRNKRPLYREWYPKLLKDQTVFWGGSEMGSEVEKNKIWHPEQSKAVHGYSSYQTIGKFYEEFKASGRTNYLDWMTWLDLNYRLPELLLARLDRMTMAAAVEGRVPFMDHKFAELCMSIPADMKLGNNTEKYLLKKAFEGTLPHEILYRPKMGFPVPLNNILFNDEFVANAHEELKAFNTEQQLFNNNYLAQLMQPGNGKAFWNALNLSLWYKAMK